MTKFFHNSINFIFGLINLWLQFGKNKFFPKKLRTASHRFLPAYQNLEKTGDLVQRETWTEGTADKTYFTEPIQLLLGVQFDQFNRNKRSPEVSLASNLVMALP